MQLVYTPIYAAISALLILFLALRVVLARRAKKIGIGDKGDKEMLQRIRVHANAIEYLPITLLLMAMAEINQINIIFLNIGGVLLIISRLLHANGLGSHIGVSFGRYYGTLINWLLILVFAAYLLFKSALMIF